MYKVYFAFYLVNQQVYIGAVKATYTFPKEKNDQNSGLFSQTIKYNIID